MKERETNMKNKFKDIYHNNLMVALNEYGILAEQYEDVRLEKVTLSFGSEFYVIRYRYPKAK